MNRAAILGVAAAVISFSGLASASPTTACSAEPPASKAAAPTKDIVDTAVAAGSFKTLAAALGAAGLVDALKGPGPFTVFAPTDEAFAKLPKGTVETLLKPENKAKLQQILKYHVVAGKATSKDVAGLRFATTLAGQRVDLAAKGGKVTVDGATVTTPDVMATNGVIHVLDTVILPADKDIVDTAAAAGFFSTLLAAAKAAGLEETLRGAGPLTVFAPTDEAFAKLPPGTVENLLKPENKDKLTAILTYHVVPGKVMAADVVGLDEAKTVNGKMIDVQVEGSAVKVNEAAVTATDIAASNGVIHIIDTVILPPEG